MSGILLLAPKGKRANKAARANDPAVTPRCGRGSSLTFGKIMRLSTLVTLTLLASAPASHASSLQKVIVPASHLVTWSRDRVEVMTQSADRDSNESLCMISPFDLPSGRAALLIWFKQGHISSISSGPALIGYSFSIDDLETTGVPDLIQIKEAKTDRVVEAFSIIDGIVEPLPDEQFNQQRRSFSPGDPVVAYLKGKRGGNGRTRR
jgi:hypothetical protein